MDNLKKLIEKSRRGDRRAQDQLILKVQNRVYYHCRKILSNEEDALDATQDILIAMLKGLGNLREAASFWPWLNRITANICCKHLRAIREQPFPELDTMPQVYENFDDQSIPERILDTEENRRLIRDLVDGLPDVQRICILCYYYDEMSIRDIAEAMETSENTVKSRLHYARRAIKEGVERYTAQGLRLFTFSPLPFLQYFLQQEASNSTLAPAAAEALRQGLLAAGAIGAAGTAGAVGAAGAAGTAIKAAGGAAIHKGLLALAGLALVGSIGVSVDRPAPPSPAKALPVAEVTQPVLPEEEPAGQLLSKEEEPPSPEPQVPVEPSRRLPRIIRGPVVDLLAPENQEVKTSVPESSESSESSNFDFSDSSDSFDSTTEDPTPAPQPVPEPRPVVPEPEEPDSNPDTSIPEQPDPPSTNLFKYLPNPDMGTYLGENDQGIHEFSTTLLSNGQELPAPFLRSDRYMKLEVSDGARVSLFANYVYGKSPGTCEVRYYYSTSAEGPYELKAIAHVTVLPSEPLTIDYDWGGYWKTDSNGVYLYRRTLPPGQALYNSPIARGQYYSKVESSDETVVKVQPNTSRFMALALGTAEVRYYIRWAESDPWVLTASVQVTVEEESVTPPPPPVASKAMQAGYGYIQTFSTQWAEALPEKLTYVSSKPSVVQIDETGRFVTLLPGKADLTATDPEGHRYVLTVQVEDAFSWEYTLEDVTLSVGQSQTQRLSATLRDTAITDILWTSGDPLLVSVKALEDNACQLRGVAPGDTEVEAQVTFLVNTPSGPQEMTDTVSFQVHVDPAGPGEGVTVYRQDRGRFGYCSGYGYTSYFLWDWTETESLPSNLTFVSSAPDVVYINSDGKYTTFSAGTAVLSAWNPDDPSQRYELTVVVQDSFDWSCPFPDFTQKMELSESHSFAYSMGSDQRIKSVSMTSSDPDVAEAQYANAYTFWLVPHKPGVTTLSATFTFQVYTAMQPQPVLMEAHISCQVTVAYSRETETRELTQFGFRSGYGYAALFSQFFPDFPGDRMEYNSSNSNVVSIGFNGDFTTLGPGQATLTATPLEDPNGRQYALRITVQDCFDWEYTLEDLTLEEGETAIHTFSSYELHPNATIRNSNWQAQDPLTAFAKYVFSDPAACSVTAKSAGVTTVKGTLSLKVNYLTYGSKSYSVPVTFQVRIVSPEAPEETPGGEATVDPDVPSGGGTETNTPPDTGSAGESNAAPEREPSATQNASPDSASAESGNPTPSFTSTEEPAD